MVFEDEFLSFVVYNNTKIHKLKMNQNSVALFSYAKLISIIKSKI